MKILITLFFISMTSNLYSQDIKKNRDQICDYNTRVGNLVQGVINSFEAIVRFGKSKGFSKKEVLGMKDQWIKTYRKRDVLAEENIKFCNMRGNPFKRWKREYLEAINKNVGRVNSMASELEGFVNQYPSLKRIRSVDAFLKGWNRMKKPNNFFR